VAGEWSNRNTLPRCLASPIFTFAETEEMAVLDEPRLLASNPWVARRPITVAEYHRMGEVGILTEDDRVELIEGELVAMSPIGSYHAGTVNKLNHSLVHAVGERAIVSVQNPVRLDDHSEPEPDFALLRPRPDFYQDAAAQPDDVLLLIEVADTSLNYDRAVKRALYARHAIPELWIVDLTSGEVEVCRAAKADGYAAVERVGRDGVLEPELLPGVRIQVATLLR
jgi:Uma2 family endonuclease